MFSLFEYFTIARSKLFDPVYYLSTYEDVRVADMDPIRHYLIAGWKEGRNPSANFDTNFYLEQNQDVFMKKVNLWFITSDLGRMKAVFQKDLKEI